MTFIPELIIHSYKGIHVNVPKIQGFFFAYHKIRKSWENV